MTEDQFWQLIDEARRSVPDPKDVPKWLVEHLKDKPVGDIFDFSRNITAASSKAYDFRLWAAATAILDGSCGDDAFHDFSAWLIEQGCDVFDKAINDPDSLADLKDFRGADGYRDSISSVAFTAYQEKTGRTDFWESFSDADLAQYDLKNREAWDGELESLPQVVPRLYERFLANKGSGQPE
jgi:Protein of unknown function (DUF4240)